MEKGFWNLKVKQKQLYVLIFCVGILISAGMILDAYQDSKLQNGRELPKNKAGAGAYEQKLFAHIEGMEKVPLTVVVEEEQLTEKEAEALFEMAIPILEQLMKGENKSFQEISKDLRFIDEIPDMPIEVAWMPGYSEYFYSDGTLKKDVENLDFVEVKISAILSCQAFSKEFEKVVTILPKEKNLEWELFSLIEQSVLDGEKEDVVVLPETYKGQEIRWKKPVDFSVFCFPILIPVAIVCLKIGHKRDEQQEKKRRLDQLEKEYAQIVSKFTMLLSAGLSIRNAWERIVRMEGRKQYEKKLVFEEMNWALREMQKGISELDVYEMFAARTGQVHYKKLMALFISHKRRGGGSLLENMNQEMLQAWEERKRKAKQQGEMIGTKLLIPMMGMLGIVFVMILVPAFLVF